MSRQRSSSERGFTILECEIALLVLTLAVIFTMKLIAGHDVLLQSMDGWLMGDDPTWYVVAREDKFERALEHAADLWAAPPPGGSAGPSYIGPDEDYLVTVPSVSRELHPPVLSIQLQMRPR